MERKGILYLAQNKGISQEVNEDSIWMNHENEWSEVTKVTESKDWVISD